MGNRKKTEEYILKYINKIAPGGFNKKLYTDLFKSMSNKDFDSFMVKLRDGKIHLRVISPNTKKQILSVENNFVIAKELGYEFEQQLIVSNDGDAIPYKTPNTFLVMDLTYRRAAQLLTKKISIPSDDKSIDLTTGQVTGKSKGSKLTMPEIQVLTGMGLTSSIKELLKYRGGDLGGSNAMMTLLERQGSVNQAGLEQYATGVVSTKTLKTYLSAQMIGSTF